MKAYAEENEFGYWVGCIEHPDGTKARVTNAKYTEAAALEIAQRMIDSSNHRNQESKTQ